MDNRKTTAKKNLSINDQLQAMQSGELVCSPEKLSACIAYCQRRLDMLHRSPDNSNVLLGAGPGKYCKIHQFSHLGRKTVGKYLNCCSLSLFALDTVSSCRKLPAFCRMNRREEH